VRPAPNGERSPPPGTPILHILIWCPERVDAILFDMPDAGSKDEYVPDLVLALITRANAVRQSGKSRDADGQIQELVSVVTASKAIALLALVPFAYWRGIVTDSDDRWLRIRFPDEAELDVSVESDGDVEFEWDVGAPGPERRMLAFGVRDGYDASTAAWYSILSADREETGRIAPEDLPDMVRSLFDAFRAVPR
jgi:hypothetical protein